MLEHDSDTDRSRQSLLSLGLAAPSPTGGRGAGSLLSSSAATNENDPATRHRLARSRREAAPSPLLAALASLEAYRAESDPEPEPEPILEPAAEPVAGPRTTRWTWRNLFSPRVKVDQPEVAPRIAEAIDGPAESQAPVAAENAVGLGESAEKPEQAGRFAQAAPANPSEPDEVEEKPETIGWFAAPPAPGESDPVEAAPPPAIEQERQEQQRYERQVRSEAVSPADPRWSPLVDPLSVIGGIAASKNLIVATTIIGALIGVGVAITTPKKYEAVAELLIDPRDLKLTDRDLTQTGLPNDATLAIVENQVRMLTSGTVLNRVVDKLDLAADSEFNGQRGGGIGSFISSLRGLLSFGKGSGGGDLRRALAVGNLAESLHVERGGKTFVVSIGATTEAPEKSALIANTLIEVFFEAYGELQSNTAGRATDELLSRLDELRSGLEAAERAVERYRTEHDLVDAQGKLISDDELVKLNEQLSIARARKIELNARAQSTLSVNVDAVLGGGLPEELASPVMSELRTQYAAMRQEADQLSVRLGPRHPQYLAMQAQLQGARGQIANELRRIVATVQTELRRAVRQEQDLSARLAELKVRSGDVNVDLVALRELEREATAKRAVYEGYLLRAKETGEQRTINTANMSVISQAFPPLDPTGPSRAMVSLAGMLLGFLAGIGLGIARGVGSSIRESGRGRRRAHDFGGVPTAGSSNLPPAAGSADLSAATPVTPQAATEPALARQNAAEATAAGPAAADTTFRVADTEPTEMETAAAGPQETTMNPLARLMERFRKPTDDIRDPIDLAAPKSPPAAATRRYHVPQTVPGNHVRANQEPFVMYPYPPQPPAHPQSSHLQSSYPQFSHPQASYPYAPPQAPQFQPAQQQPAYPPQYAQPPQYPTHFAPQQPGYPYAPAPMPQPAFHAWQPQPVTLDMFGRPQQVVPYPAYPMPAAMAPYGREGPQAYAPGPEQRTAEQHSAEQAREMSPIEEVRESLREFRDAIRDLTESRARRSY